MRILQLTDFYRPVIGGLERHVEVLAHDLARRGHRVSVATLTNPTAPTRERDGDLSIYRLGGWHRALAPFYQDADRRFHPTAPDPGVIAGLRAVIRRERPDVIHAHGWILYFALPLARRAGAALVVTLHDYGLVCVKKTYMRPGDALCTGAALARCVRCAAEHYGPARSLALTGALHAAGVLHRRVDRYLAVSTAVAEASAPALGRADATLRVIPTFIADSVADRAGGAVGERPSFLPPDPYILFVGVLSAHKGLRVLLAAYEVLPTPRPPLVLIGTPYGSQPASYPPGVTVARNVPHAQVMAAWAHSLLGVVPSVWPDPCPQVAIEAMAAATPIVASATGGLPDLVVDGETGLLAPPGDPAALRDRLQRLIADPGLRARMGAAAAVRARRYRASTVVDAIEREYTEALQAYPGHQ